MTTKSLPANISEASPSTLHQIKGVCLDIDDTLSTAGKLTAEAYNALWKLKNAGLAVVPITGRPAGWCDHFSRFWPVDAVVGENGAFTFFMKDGIRKRIDTLGASPASLGLTQKLNDLSKQVQSLFPQARWASDQSYREYDLAIDICEDVTPWSPAQIDSLLTFCKKQGAHAKLSSIHVNTWFGEYDKATGFKYWLSQGAPGFKGAQIPAHEEWIYIGDSPNDEPMFQYFKYSVGVANLNKYLDKLTHRPTWITNHESGAGFSELAEALIQSRK